MQLNCGIEQLEQHIEDPARRIYSKLCSAERLHYYISQNSFPRLPLPPD